MIENLEGEVWMTHPQFDWVAASNYGRIKSLERDVVKSNGVVEHRKEKLIEPFLAKNGYLRLRIKNTNLGIDDKKSVHRFCYESFHKVEIPNGSNELQINHINEIKTDNRIENLELCTPKENCNYGTRNERSANARSKRVGQYTLDGNLVKIWKSTAECGRNGYDQSNVAACCRGERKTHKGYLWKFID